MSHAVRYNQSLLYKVFFSDSSSVSSSQKPPTVEEQRQKNVPLFQSSFKPFQKNPRKQERYDKYLELVKLGHKGLFTIGHASGIRNITVNIFLLYYIVSFLYFKNSNCVKILWIICINIYELLMNLFLFRHWLSMTCYF